MVVSVVVEVVVEEGVVVVVVVLAEVIVVMVRVLADTVLVESVSPVALLLGHSAIERFAWYMNWVSTGAVTCKWCALIQSTSKVLAVRIATHSAL